MIRNLWCAVGGTLLLLVACGDSDDDGDGGSSSTSSTSSTTSSTSGTGGAGGSGGGSCLGCGDFVAACVVECPAGDPEELVCAGSSWDMLNAINTCLCSASEGDCETACPNRCTTGTGEYGDDCLACQGAAVSGVCKPQFDSCMADMQ